MGWKHADSYTKSKGLLQRRVLLPWLGSSSCCSAHAEAYHLRGGWHVKQPYDTGNYKYLTHELAYAYDIQAYKHVCMYLYIYIHTRLTDFLHIYRPSRDHSQIPRYKWECLKIRSAPSPQIFIENAMFGALLFWSTSTLFFFNDYTILYYNHTCWNYLHPLKVNTTPKSYPNSTSFRRFWWYSKRRGKDYKTTSSTHPFLQLPNLLQQPCHQQEGIQTTLWEWDLAPTQS